MRPAPDTPTGPRASLGRRGLQATLLLLQLLALAACARPEAPTLVGGEEKVVSLSNSHASPSALGRAVVKALEEDDREALRAVRVTRQEWLDLFWPELPESDDTPFDFAWQMKNDRSRVAEVAALEEFGGRKLEFLVLRFTQPPEVHEGFTLHFGAQLWARRASDGQRGVIPILSVVVERDGLWKLSNLVD